MVHLSNHLTNRHPFNEGFVIRVSTNRFFEDESSSLPNRIVIHSDKYRRTGAHGDGNSKVVWRVTFFKREKGFEKNCRIIILTNAKQKI